MKSMKNILYVAAGLVLAACSHKSEIVVSNTLDFDRSHELVKAEVCTEKPHVLKDAEGFEVGYQVVEGGIVFLADVPAGATATYQWVEGTPAPVEKRVDAFFLGDRRKDDFAWENEYAAYRMYGPALLPENPSSGVDLWLKHGEAPCADAMYKQEEGGKPYHVDYGLGIDSYKVGHAAGCGGVAIVTADGQIWPGGPFKTWEILQEGPLQTIFRLTYDSVQVADKVWQEEILITVNAGSQVNKAEVIFTGEAIDSVMIGGAYFHHDDPFVNITEKVGNTQVLACAEPATSDKGIYAVHERMGIDATTLDFGRNYVTVIVPQADAWGCSKATEYAAVNYQMGQTVTYYFGGGWSKREYTTDDAWFLASKQTAEAISNPLTVNLK